MVKSSNGSTTIAILTSMTITKADLAATIVLQTDMPQKQVPECCVDVILASITEALLQGDKVEIRGFGSFRIRERGPRAGRNPRTGEPVHVRAKCVVYFTPGEQIREGLLSAS